MRTKYKQWANDLLLERKDLLYENFDNFIYDDKKIILEIGSGKGEFLAKMAFRFPNYFFVGVEKNTTCAGITLKKIINNQLDNARLICDDINDVIASIKENSIEGIILNFSDPWPKKRHHKRRLTNENLILKYHEILKKDGFLNFKTDNRQLFDDSIKYFSRSPFKILKIDYDYKFDSSFDEITDYEMYYRDLNQPIYKIYLIKE